MPSNEASDIKTSSSDVVISDGSGGGVSSIIGTDSVIKTLAELQALLVLEVIALIFQ
jgi:hypothetical protein